MENASKALIMAGTMLIGLLLLALFVWFFSSASGMRSKYTEHINDIRVSEFNAKFLKYAVTADTYGPDGRNYVTIHDIVSLARYANEYNQDFENHEVSNYIIITLQNYGDITKTSNDPDKDYDNVIKENLTTLNNDNEVVIKKFVLAGEVEYNNETGRIKQMDFVELTE